MTAIFYPSLRYRDGDAAVTWLRDAFGFEAGGIYRDDDGRIRHGELWLDGAAIMFGEGEPNHDPTGFYAAVDEVDALYERVVSSGAELVRELQETPYGSREFAARDLEGNVWSFGTYRPSKQ